MNVLPILTHTDALCRDELAAVQLAIRHDLAEAFKEDEGRGFGIFGRIVVEEDGRRVSPCRRSFVQPANIWL